MHKTDRKRFAFLASNSELAQSARNTFVHRLGDCDVSEADVIVALGGDGFMLQTLHTAQHLNVPVYGINRGTVGFLMNEFSIDHLSERLAAAKEVAINPLRMNATCTDGSHHTELAINEVSLLRLGPQAAKLKVFVDDRLRLSELVCDGALVATPAGSTAYNYSAHGPILPIRSEVLALTAMAAFRPRRWRGAVLPKVAKVRFEVIEPIKRPVMADADSRSVQDVVLVEIESAGDIAHRLLFDPDHGLEERLIQEQFS